MEDTYFQYIEEQVERFKNYAMLFELNGETVSPVKVNRGLAEYDTINIALIAEENRVKTEHSRFMMRYNAFWDECYLKSRESLNPISLAGTKWASGKEIESHARHNNKEEFEKWENERIELESKLALLRRMTKMWDNHYSILITLSTNMRSEMKSLGIVDHANNSVHKASRRPVS